MRYYKRRGMHSERLNSEGVLVNIGRYLLNSSKSYFKMNVDYANKVQHLIKSKYITWYTTDEYILTKSGWNHYACLESTILSKSEKKRLNQFIISSK